MVRDISEAGWKMHKKNSRYHRAGDIAMQINANKKRHAPINGSLNLEVL